MMLAREKALRSVVCRCHAALYTPCAFSVSLVTALSPALSSCRFCRRSAARVREKRDAMSYCGLLPSAERAMMPRSCDARMLRYAQSLTPGCRRHDDVLHHTSRRTSAGSSPTFRPSSVARATVPPYAADGHTSDSAPCRAPIGSAPRYAAA